MNKSEKIPKDDIFNRLEKYMEVMRLADIGFFEWNEHDGIIFSENINEKFNFQNYSVDNFNNFIFDDDIKKYIKFINGIKSGKVFSQVQCRIKNCDNIYLWCKVSLKCDFDNENNLKGFYGIIQVIDKEVRFLNDLKIKIEFDEEAYIRNFRNFVIKTEELIKQKLNSKFSIFVMSIDKFKIINDVYGIDAGKNILRQVSIILQRILPSDIIFCVRYANNFCLCMEYFDESDIDNIILKIVKEISLSKFIVEISPIFGVYIINDRDLPIEIMCDRANMAKKNYNLSGNKNYIFFDCDFRKKVLEEASIEAEMHKALDNRKFFIHLQPKYNLKNRNIVGAEALVRWNRNRNDFLLPNKFLHIFEKNGFIIKLDEYIWEEACRILRKWIDLGFNPVPVSVNISRRQIFNPNFLDMILWLTDKYNIPQNLIGLELPESVFIDNSDIVYKILEKIKRYGFILEMDDFGEGYSSLKMLQNINVDIIKIDKGFLDETINKKGRIVVKHAIIMAKELNLKVIAEGVENKEQVDFLGESGCEIAQGFYFSKPLSLDEFEYKAFYSIGR